jgi:hypothetical protein
MSSPAINTVIKMMESLLEEEQDGIVEHLREYIQDLQDEHQCLTKHREIVKKVLERYAYYYMYPYQDDRIQCQLFISQNRNHYFLVIVGNDNIRRVFHCIFHLEIKNNQIYILHQDSNTNILEYKLQKELDKAYIAKDRLIPLKDYTNSSKYAPHNCYYYIPEIILKNSLTSEEIYNLYPESFTYIAQNKAINLKYNTEPKQLIKIFKIISRYRFTQIYDLIGASISIHHNTPSDLLKKIFLDFPLQVLSNPKLKENTILLEEIYKQDCNIFHEKDLKLPDYAIKWAINHEREYVRIVVAQNIKLPKFWQLQLLEDNSCAVIQVLYRNASLLLEIREQVQNKQLELEKSCFYKSNYGCNNSFCPLAADEIPF